MAEEGRAKVMAAARAEVTEAVEKAREAVTEEGVDSAAAVSDSAVAVAGTAEETVVYTDFRTIGKRTNGNQFHYHNNWDRSL